MSSHSLPRPRRATHGRPLLIVVAIVLGACQPRPQATVLGDDWVVCPYEGIGGYVATTAWTPAADSVIGVVRSPVGDPIRARIDLSPIEATGGRSRQMLTDSLGRFILRDFATGTYRFEVRGLGFVSLDRQVEVRARGTPDTVYVELGCQD